MQLIHFPTFFFVGVKWKFGVFDESQGSVIVGLIASAYLKSWPQPRSYISSYTACVDNTEKCWDLMKE